MTFITVKLTKEIIVPKKTNDKSTDLFVNPCTLLATLLLIPYTQINGDSALSE